MFDSGLPVMKIKKIILTVLLIIAPVMCIILSAFLGRYQLSPSEIFHAICSRFSGSSVPDVNANIVWEIRLPRAILGSMVGASLAVSGASLQGLFRNPLVSSGMLGVSAGAGFGASSR